jgi:peptidoglycan/xylan/chitin deacetylase (PgdA/CDA1 family)
MMLALMYHDVVEADAGSSSGFQGADAEIYKVSPATLLRHLALVPPSNIKPTFTFDDAGASAISPCADLLESMGLRGVFFVPTSFIGKTGFCSRTDIADLYRRGHTVGSHSSTHPVPISSLGERALNEEWKSSKAVLESIVGAPVLVASVPGGFTSARVEASVEACGYDKLFTSSPTRRVRTLGALQIYGRFTVTRFTPDTTVRDVLQARHFPWLRQQLAWSSKSLVKRVGGQGWLTFRRWYFSNRSGSNS